MSFIVRMTPPTGPAEYLPEGFGFTKHAHTLDPAEAERFPTSSAASRRALNYRSPPAFWESERRHAAAQERKFRDWRFDMIEVNP